MTDRERIQALIRAAQSGSREAMGQALESCRLWLLKAAQEELGTGLQAKVGPSDLVQESIAEACEGFGRFAGSTEEDLLAWLRQILRNNVRDCLRRYRDSEKRDVRREVALAGTASASTAPLPDGRRPPDESAAAHEEERRLEEAMARLPEEYQQVLRLHNQEHLPFEEVGERMGRSANAARKLWARAVERLTEEFGPAG